MKNLIWIVCVLLAFTAGYFVNHFSSETLSLDDQSQAPISAPKDATDNNNVVTSNTTALTPSTNTVESENDVRAPTTDEIAQQLKALIDSNPMALTFSEMANFYSFVGELSEVQLLAVIQELSNTGVKENQSALMMLFSRYTEINAAAAIDFAKTEIGDERLQSAMLNISLISLAQQDPLASYDHFIRLTDAQQNIARASNMHLTGSLMPIFSSLAKQDLSLAIDKLYELNKLGHKLMLPMWGLTQNLESKQEFVDLLTLTKSLDNHEIEEGIISKWTRHNPEEVGAWLLEDYDGERLEQLKYNFIMTWASNDREKSGNWLIDNTAPDKVQRKVVNFLRSWAWDEPKAAMQWFSKQPNAIYNQRTFAEFIDNAAHSKPQFAMKYMSYLDSKKDQQRLSETIYQGLKRKSTQQAKDFLEQSPFKDEILEFDEYLKKSL